MNLDNVMHAQNEVVSHKYLLITALLFWCALIVVSSVYVTTPLVSVFSSTFQITQAMAAWASSVFSFFYAIGFLVFGPLADKYGRKQIIVFGLGALAVVTFLIGFTDHFFWLVILRGVQGFVAATFAPTALSYAFDIYPKEKLVTAIGFLSFGYLMAGIFGQVSASIIDQTFDWKVIFFIFGVLYLLSMIAVIRILPTYRQQLVFLGMTHFFIQVKTILKQRNLILCYITTIILLLTFIGMYTVLGDYLRSPPFSLADKEIIYIRAAGIIGMIFSPFTGLFIKKCGVLNVLRIGLGMAVLGLGFLGFTTSLICLVLISVFYVSGISIIFPAIMMLIGELGGEQRATASSLYAFILFIGATLGPVIAIFLIQTWSILVTFLVLALFLLIGSVAIFLIKH